LKSGLEPERFILVLKRWFLMPCFFRRCSLLNAQQGS
jgi:hypothetical protein